MVPVPREEKKNPGIRRVSSGTLGWVPSKKRPGPGSLPSSMGQTQAAIRKVCKIGVPYPKACNPPDPNNLLIKLAGLQFSICDKSHREVAQPRLLAAVAFSRYMESWKSEAF